MPYVDKVESVKNTGVSQPRWAIWREMWKWSCLPSLLYCISRKTVDTEYTYYSWCMTSTDIVKWRKNEWLWTFWKRNDLYENFEKRGVVEKRGEGETKSMPHAPVIPAPYLIVCQIHYYSSPQNNFLARIFLIKNTLYPSICVGKVWLNYFFYLYFRKTYF